MPAFAPAAPPASVTDRIAAEILVGTTLRGKWHLDELLGVGGMAAVYAATHRNGMRGAVKLLHARYAQTDGATLRFLREGYLANKVEHPGIVRVLDDDVCEDGRPFLVMDLLTGTVLEQRALECGGRLEPREVLELMHQLLDVLVATHAHGVVHRDIKPANLFLTNSGVLKVLDFGIARLFEQELNEVTTTQTGHLLGTPAYMSPEQACGRWHLVDAQSDLWSVGATMFELLTGELVHVEQSVAELLAATLGKPARSLASIAPLTPVSLVEVVDRALEREKAQRWLDARSMQEALEIAYEAMCGASIPRLCAEARDSGQAPVSQRPPPSKDAWSLAKTVSVPPVARSGPPPAAAEHRGLRGLLLAAGAIVSFAVVTLGIRAGRGPETVPASSPSRLPSATASQAPVEGPPAVTASVAAPGASSVPPKRTVPHPAPNAPQATSSAFDKRLLNLRH